jgi:hypothetical protein
VKPQSGVLKPKHQTAAAQTLRRATSRRPHEQSDAVRKNGFGKSSYREAM